MITEWIKTWDGPIAEAVNLLKNASGAAQPPASWIQLPGDVGSTVSIVNGAGDTVVLTSTATINTWNAQVRVINESSGAVTAGTGQAPPFILITPQGDPGVDGTNGASPLGDGVGTWTQPVTGSNADLRVTNSQAFQIGTTVRITDGADITRFVHVQVIAVDPDSGLITFKALGYGGDLAPSATITTGQKVGVVGPRGPAGPAGENGENGTNGTNGDVITNLDVTLILGTKTQASGGILSAAKIVGAPRLKTLNASPALGAQVLASISGNNVILDSYAADGSAATTDVATYTVSLAGVA